MDVTGAVHELGVFAVIVGALAGINLTQSYLRDWLRFRWRARLTHKTLDAWLGGQAYWHLRPGLSPDAIDNPDQRVAEDCNRYVELLLQETLDLIGRIVGLVTYIAILWSLSDFVLRFSLL